MHIFIVVWKQKQNKNKTTSKTNLKIWGFDFKLSEQLCWRRRRGKNHKAASRKRQTIVLWGFMGFFQAVNSDTQTTQTRVWQRCLSTSKLRRILIWGCHVSAEERFVWDPSTTRSWHNLQGWSGPLWALRIWIFIALWRAWCRALMLLLFIWPQLHVVH